MSMRKQYILVILISLGMLAGCTTSGQQQANDPGLASYKGIAAFRDACLATAPSFAAGKAAARHFGVTEFLPLGPVGIFAMTPDNALGFQFKPDQECAVTTHAYAGNRAALRAKFIAAVAEATGRPMPSATVPFTAELNGIRYIFVHDMRGGEAFVMLRAR